MPRGCALHVTSRHANPLSSPPGQVCYRWGSFGKAALGWWSEELLACLVERRVRRLRLDPLLLDGYAGDILAAVLRPRAAYVRLFPYCAPAALFVHQMASAPACFLFYPR